MKQFLILLSFICVVAHAGTVTKTSVQDICKKNGFSNCKLVQALVAVESRYNYKLHNPEKTGSYGLMQVQCGTARWIGFKNCMELFKPEHNLKVGIEYLKLIRKMHGINDIKTWIAAWNAGRPIVCKHHNPGYCKPGEFYNQAYVNEVYRVYASTERHI